MNYIQYRMLTSLIQKTHALEMESMKRLIEKVDRLTEKVNRLIRYAEEDMEEEVDISKGPF